MGTEIWNQAVITMIYI